MSDRSLEKNLVQGTVVLTITSFIVKLLSAIYRVPYQNLVGDEGFYVYQQIYPIYGIGMAFALTGLPVYLSKILASNENDYEKKKSINAFFVSVSFLCTFMFILLFFMSSTIAKMMGDQQLTPLINIVAFVFLVIPFLSTYRGVYQGELEMKPTAISQLAEQGSRVTIILLAGYLFTKLELSVYQAGEFAMLGAFVGSLFGVAVLFYYRSIYPFSLSVNQLSIGYILSFLKRLIKEGGTLCFFSAYLIIFQLVDAFVIKRFLVFSGLTNSSAKIAKGVFDRGQPLVQLGLVLAVSMTASFLPPLTKHFVSGDHKAHRQLAYSYLKVSGVISSAAAVGLAFVLPYINITLFRDNKQEITLSLFVLAIYFASMIQTYQTIHQSQNSIKHQVLAAMAGLSVKIVTTPILTFYFKTIGSSLSTLMGLFVCLLALKIFYSKNNNYAEKKQRYMLKLVINLGLMIVTLIFYRLILELASWRSYNRGITLFLSLLGVFLGGVVFIVASIKTKLFTEKEWRLLPYGEKIVKRLF